ncbi:DUF6449 domain-containing protein [Acidaminobacterium chupaoyuni]
MTSNRLFFDRRMIHEKLRSNTWMTTLFTVLGFFILPVPAVYGVQRYLEAAESPHGYDLEYARKFLQEMFSLKNFGVWILLAVMAVIAATAMFRFMHQKKQVDFYHSLPISRKALFGSSYLAGFLSMMIAYFSNLLIALLIVFSMGCGRILSAEIILKSLAGNLVIFAAVYAITLLAHQMAGTMVTGLCCTGVFLILPPAFVAIWVVYMNRIFETFYLADSVLERAFSVVSPIGQVILWSIHSMTGSLNGILWWIVFALACSAVSLWMYCRRSSESAGKAVAFPAPASVIKYITVLLITLCAGELFRAVGYNYRGGWMIFGFFCGAVLSHCLIEIIYHSDFKQLFCHWKGLVVFCVAFGAGFALLVNNADRFDDFVPKENQLKSISVYVNALNQYNEFDWQKNISRDELEQSDMERRLKHTKIEDPAMIHMLLQLATKTRSGELTADPEPQDADSLGAWNNDSTQMTVCYEKTSGRKIYRQYSGIRWEGALPYLQQLYDTPEYRSFLYPLYTIGTSQVKAAAIYNGNREFYSRGDTKEYTEYGGFVRGTQARQLADILLKELEQVKAEQMEENPPLTYIDFSWDENFRKSDNKTNDFQRLPVYPQCAQTIAVLKNEGLWEPLTLLPEDISAAYVSNDNYGWKDIVEYKGNTEIALPAATDKYYQEITITNQESIALLLKNAVSEEMGQMDPFFKRDPLKTRFDVNNDRFSSFFAVYPAGKFPMEALKTVK